MASAVPLQRGVEARGILGCNQTHWYQIPLAQNEGLSILMNGQALDNAAGAAVALAIVDRNSTTLNEAFASVYARGPSWDHAEAKVAAQADGIYYFHISEGAQSCQRVQYRVLAQ